MFRDGRHIPGESPARFGVGKTGVLPVSRGRCTVDRRYLVCSLWSLLQSVEGRIAGTWGSGFTTTQSSSATTGYVGVDNDCDSLVDEDDEELPAGACIVIFEDTFESLVF